MIRNRNEFNAIRDLILRSNLDERDYEICMMGDHPVLVKKEEKRANRNKSAAKRRAMLSGRRYITRRVIIVNGINR